ncbi:ADP-ribosylglycohydrolase family protein [Micromonospora avicenniae]|uniref:ADP-ribosylglycohydrolase family protein n=1 Tax=Micromonospora avicenniae TaxID=1198245 RepID=UPI0009711B63|nr:ADP-ribosylglycohydrolase family protein [Micromonospora avicenniae]
MAACAATALAAPPAPAAAIGPAPTTQAAHTSAAAGATSVSGPGDRLSLSRETYADRLQAMWLAECIANWTGLRTELQRAKPPFYTDDDWGTNQGQGGAPIDFVIQDPWGADDDTDIEYVYTHLMANVAGSPWLSPEQIADGWRRHINNFIWVSDARARGLMERGILPPSTGMNVANTDSLMIDAQLTTEVFGAVAPGRPDRALQLADLPIRTTADGYATHISQYYVALYALAPVVDQRMTGRDQALWLTREARRFLPNTSKAADIVDFVLADFLANPDVNDWEKTRDRIHQRYQVDAAEHGFIYRADVEAAINFATGIMALLYGQTDYRRTIQIGTLSGWDSDNPTATLGGLIGLMRGTDYIRAQFPGVTLSDRYNINRTRDNMPDYLPDDAQAEDTFTMLAGRMLPLVDEMVRSGGGTVSTKGWAIPMVPAPDPGRPASLASANPAVDLYLRSANNQVRRAGGKVQSTTSATGTSDGGGRPDPALFADGREANFSGNEPRQNATFFTGRIDGPATFDVTYDRPVEVDTVRFMGGDTTQTGGWLKSARVELRGLDGRWQKPPSSVVQLSKPSSEQPYQIVDFALGRSLRVTGVRVVGDLGESEYASVAEVDALAPAKSRGSGVVDSPLMVTPASAALTPGAKLKVVVALPHGGARPWNGRLTLDADGLRVSPKSVNFRNMRPGGQASAVFQVQVPEDTRTLGLRHLTAEASVAGIAIPSATAVVSVFTFNDIRPLVATAGRGNSIQLGWRPADAGKGLVRYRVYGSTDPGFVVGPATLLAEVDDTSFAHTETGLNETWHYRVIPVDDGGVEGTVSNLASATTGSVFLIEAESLTPPAEATAPYQIQGDCCGVNWSDGRQLWFQAEKVGDRLTLRFEVPQAGRYDLTLAYTKAWDFGIQTRTLDGEPLGEAYDHSTSGDVAIDRQTYGSVDLTAGMHELSFVVTGKQATSPRYGFGVDTIELQPQSTAR